MQEKSASNLIYPASNGKFNHVTEMRYMENRKTRYAWNYEEHKFEKLVGLDFNYIQCSELCCQQGLDTEEQAKRFVLCVCNMFVKI